MFHTYERMGGGFRAGVLLLIFLLLAIPSLMFCYLVLVFLATL